MIKKWAGYAVLLALCFCWLPPAAEVRAADSSVRVTLPDFPVKLNGHTVENQYREFPLLVYKDITYFPMTWYDSRLLGLETTWTPENGLNIFQSQVASSYVPYKTDRRNAAAYKAEIVASPVTVAGFAIDNTKEEYPLISFRDVTYFPLTWRFAHNQFGWDYNWDDAMGLTIQSHNPQVLAADLPEFAGENDAALFKGYYYFVETTGTKNQVYRVSVHSAADKELVYSYSIESGYGLNKYLSFQIRDSELWFKYHVGGNIMGGDEYVLVSDDGRAEVMQKGYLDFRKSPFGTLIINMGNSPFSGNLYFLEPGQDWQTRKPVGNPNLMYGRPVTLSDNNGVGVGSDYNTTLIGDHVYVLGSSYPESKDDLNKVYKINLKTNDTAKVVNDEVAAFQVLGDKLYYVKKLDGNLYASNLDGTGEHKLSDNSVSWFGNMNDNVYYTTKVEEGKYQLYQARSDGKDPLVLRELLKDVRIFKGKLLCLPVEGGDYGIKLLNGSGRVILSVTDPVSRVLTSDDAILFTTSEDASIRFIR